MSGQLIDLTDNGKLSAYTKYDDVTGSTVSTDDVIQTDSSSSAPVNFRLLRGYRRKKRRQNRHDVPPSSLPPRRQNRSQNDAKPPDYSSVLNDDVLEMADMKLPRSKMSEVQIMVVNRKKMCINCLKRFAAFLLSTVGLSVLTVAYSILGGLLFRAVEAPFEQEIKTDVRDALDWHIAKLWDVTDQFNVLHQVNWSREADDLLRNFTYVVFNATKQYGWDGNVDSQNTDVQWSFAGSLLFSVTVITTIGYGTLAPKTAWGRFLTIPYAVIGIPLTLLTIAHLGGFMATVFRFIYKSLVCRLCTTCRRRREMRPVSVATPLRDQSGCCVADTPEMVIVGGGGLGIASDDDGPVLTSLHGDAVAVRLVTASGCPENLEPKRRGLRGSRLVTTAMLNETGRVALDRMRRSYRGIVEWRRGITNALYTEDNRQVQVPLYVSLLLIIGYVSLGAMMFSLWEEDWDFLIGSYFCFITLSTIGFGDFVPGTSLNDPSQQKLVLCSLYLVCGLALLAMCFDLMQEEARKTFRKFGHWIGLLTADDPPVIASAEIDLSATA